MSATDNTIEEWRREGAPERRRTDGMIRRMPIGITGGVRWRVTGHLLLDSRTREAYDAEVFGGVGFYARPKSGSNAEAIVVFPGDDAQNPIIIATRDEDARKAIAKLAEDDSTAVFNSQTIILIKKDGTVEIRSASGPVQPTILGQTYRTAEDTLLTALGVFATAIGALNPTTSAAAAATLNTAITAFTAAASSYLTVVLRAQ